MPDKITLGSIASFQNDTTAVAQYNANNALITAALDNSLSRDGTSPNQMLSALDLNGNVILNGTQSGIIASNIPVTPAGGITSNNVQTALVELDTKKAAISSLANVALSGAGADLVTNGISWTPVLTFVTPGDLAVAYTAQSGKYWQLSSNLVLAQFNLVTSSFTFTTASGNLKVTGIPFTSQNTGGLVPRGGLSFGGITKAGYTQIATGFGVNTNFFIFNASGSGQATAIVTAADTPSAGTVALTGEVIFFI